MALQETGAVRLKLELIVDVYVYRQYVGQEVAAFECDIIV